MHASVLYFKNTLMAAPLDTIIKQNDYIMFKRLNILQSEIKRKIN